MVKSFCLGAVLLLSSAVFAQPLRNAAERANDKQDLRQDRRQTADDTLDVAKARALLIDYDAAAARGDAQRLGVIEAAFSRHLQRELAESRLESAQARQEVRQDKREVRSDRREVRRDVAVGRRPGVVADDAHDTRRDRGNLADDRVDAVKERLSRERLEAIDTRLRPLAGHFDAGSVAQKRQLYAEVVGVELNEVRRDNQETREDHRELREDRRETVEDRRR